MEVVKKTDDYTIIKKRSGRFGVKGPGSKWIGGDQKVDILVKAGVLKAAPKKAKPKVEAPAEEPKAEAAAPEAPAEAPKEEKAE